MLKTAQRIESLGTETAFAVSAEAAALAAAGKKIYPFHLGDLNFKTPGNIVMACIKAIFDGKTNYCPTAGIPQLREALAEDINGARGTHYKMENVAIQPGGKPAIGKFIMALMNFGDEVLYPNPGYPIYESQIEFNGGKAIPYAYEETVSGFRIDIESIQRNISPKTKAIILNDPQNPTGADCSPEDLQTIADIAIKHNLVVLSDEAYFDIRYEGAGKSIASLPGMEERTIILYTFSKKFAMSGWRLGAAIGPKEIIDIIAKLNVNDESCSNHFVQYGALAGLTGPQDEVKKMLEVLKERRDLAANILNSIQGVYCSVPSSTFYLFANVTDLIEQQEFENVEDFRKNILYNTGVSFCTRLHFGRPSPAETDRYIRLAYAGVDKEIIAEGLAKLKTYLEERSVLTKKLIMA